MSSYADLKQDLRERWLPSEEQMRQADALLAAGYDAERGPDRERGVYTAHLLENKEYGIWTEDVRIVHLDGVFLTREAVLTFVNTVARQRHEEGGQKVTGGWAWHSKVGHAAVWEDICSRFGEEA